MKRLIIVLVALLTTSLFAEEGVLFDSTTLNANSVNEYSYENWEGESNTGWYADNDIKFLGVNDRGLGFIVTNVPNTTTHYEINPAYPTFLNDPGIGTGHIENVDSIKSIKLTATLNRTYDDIIMYYSTSPNGPIHKVLFTANSNSHSMQEAEFVWNNPSYIEDVTKRQLKNYPIVGSEVGSIYLRGFSIKCNASSGFNGYSPYSVVYLKKVDIIYDKMLTDEQYETNKLLKEELNIDETNGVKEKALREIETKQRLIESEKEKMHVDESQGETVENPQEGEM